MQLVLCRGRALYERVIFFYFVYIVFSNYTNADGYLNITRFAVLLFALLLVSIKELRPINTGRVEYYYNRSRGGR